MNYYYYFTEINNRCSLFIVTVISTTFAVYQYKEILLFLICSNMTFSFIHTNITEIFYTYIKLISFITNQICVIYFFFHIIVFVSPGLYISERRTITAFFCVSFLTYIFAVLFLNYVLLPLSFEFFLSFQNITTYKSLDFYFEAKIEDYFYLYEILYYICQFYCQLSICLISFFCYCDNKLKEIKLFRKLFYFVFCCLLFSNTIFYSDIFLQIFFCFCVIVTHEFSIFCFFIKKNLINRQPLETKNYSNYK